MKREYYEENGKIFLKCNKCGEFKEATRENFNKARKNLFGCACYCKRCTQDYNSNRYINKKDEILVRTNNYYHSHKELYSNYYVRNQDKIKARVKKWKEDNSERVKKYWLENRERISNKYILDESTSQRRKEWEKKYREIHRDIINAKRRERNKQTGQGKAHLKVNRVIRKLGIRPTKCPICGAERRIEAHHPDYNKPYEIVFCCNVCHQRIHNGWFECPKPIDLQSILF